MYYRFYINSKIGHIVKCFNALYDAIRHERYLLTRGTKCETFLPAFIYASLTFHSKKKTLLKDFSEAKLKKYLSTT